MSEWETIFAEMLADKSLEPGQIAKLAGVTEAEVIASRARTGPEALAEAAAHDVVDALVGTDPLDDGEPSPEPEGDSKPGPTRAEKAAAKKAAKAAAKVDKQPELEQGPDMDGGPTDAELAHAARVLMAHGYRYHSGRLHAPHLDLAGVAAAAGPLVIRLLAPFVTRHALPGGREVTAKFQPSIYRGVMAHLISRYAARDGVSHLIEQVT